MKKIIYILLLFTIVQLNSAQTQIEAIGVYGGFGSIKGNSASVSSFTSSVFIDTKLFFTGDATIRFSFFYARKLESLLPEGSTGRYFPFQRGISTKLVLIQPLSAYFYIEEGLGPLFLNDRTFSDTDKWGIGFALHLVAGIDLRNDNDQGFKLALGSDLGNTFNATTPMYFSAHFQTTYYF